MRTRALIFACALLLLAPLSQAAPVASGSDKSILDIDGTAIEVHTYKPARYAGGPVLLTLHGVGRNAAGYRDYAKALADRYGFLVVAPLFDRKRFPTLRYQTVGMQLGSPGDGGAPELGDGWAGRMLLGMVDRIRAIEKAPELPYYMLGHSGGGQLLSRVAGLIPTESRRIVIANPGTHLWPTREIRFPYGFGGLSERWSDDDAIRRYLAQPVTLLLGTADVQQDADLSMREEALAQGANRYERGRNAYNTARALAQARGWTFNWKLVEVPGVGHSARRMFGSEEAATALRP